MTWLHGFIGACAECDGSGQQPEVFEEDDGCPQDDPSCEGRAEDCHDACERPTREDRAMMLLEEFLDLSQTDNLSGCGRRDTALQGSRELVADWRAEVAS